MRRRDLLREMEVLEINRRLLNECSVPDDDVEGIIVIQNESLAIGERVRALSNLYWMGVENWSEHQVIESINLMRGCVTRGMRAK